MKVHDTIEDAIAICEAKLRALDAVGAETVEVERFVVAGLVVFIVSEYEEYLESLFRGRADLCGDAHVANFIKKTVAQKFRSPDLGKINELLKRFDKSCLDAFAAEIENSKPHAAWDSIMKARHAVVHKQGQLNLTFRELKEKYESSKAVVISVGAAIGVA